MTIQLEGQIEHKIERHLFTTRDYHQMLDAGILHEDDRVELIDGEIREMSPIDAAHAAAVKRIGRIVNKATGERFIIGIQDPVQLNDLTEPQPDISILRWHDDFYEQAHPNPGDILVLIEVANTSVAYDRDEKLPRYASSGIAEAWLVNLSFFDDLVYKIFSFSTITNDTHITHQYIKKLWNFI